MIIRKIKFNTIQSVKGFCAATQRCLFDMDLVSGRYMVDAKSIMGILSLSLDKNIELRMYIDTEAECKAFVDSLKAIDGIDLDIS